MSDSTAIEALPTQNNININVNDKPVQQMQPPPQQQMQPPPQQQMQPPPQQQMPPTNQQMQQPSIAPQSLNPNAIDLALNEMHGNSNTLQLPSKDIPMDTTNHVQDEQIKPNYIPNQNTPEYIEEKDTYDSMIEQNKKKQENQDKVDLLYEELQLPLLVSVVYFLFQLPFIQKKFITYLPSLFKTDGSLSLGGYLTKSFSFGIVIYLSLKLSKQLSTL